MATSSFSWNLLWTVLKFPVLVLGVFWAAFVVYGHVDLMPTFLQPGYESFWDDVTAYRLQAEGHKSLDELYAAYDSHFVLAFAIQYSMYAGLIPSEESALYFWIGIAYAQEEGVFRVDLGQYLLFALFFFPTFYYPVLLLIRSLAKTYTWAFCRAPRAARRASFCQGLRCPP